VEMIFTDIFLAEHRACKEGQKQLGLRQEICREWQWHSPADSRSLGSRNLRLLAVLCELWEVPRCPAKKMWVKIRSDREREKARRTPGRSEQAQF